MSELRNKISRKLLDEELKKEKEARLTLSFYKYHPIPEPGSFRDELYKRWKALNVKGRTYVAAEGINAQISLPQAQKEAFIADLYSISWLNQLRLNWAIEDDGKSFAKLDIKVRPKIVADGIQDPNFDVTQSGQHLDAADFNKMLDDPETIVVDMRNHYESEVGHFKNAITPDVDTFRDSLPIIADQLSEAKEKKVLMYCTGGIRCEKASAYMKYKGFKNVFQLNGGIIHYARQVEEQGLENKFIGKNFVFDKRMAERITDDVIAHCHQCGKPADTHTNCKNTACHLLFIQCEECAQKMDGCCCEECKRIASLPEEEQKALRKGLKTSRQVFRKGRSGRLPFQKSAPIDPRNPEA